MKDVLIIDEIIDKSTDRSIRVGELITNKDGKLKTIDGNLKLTAKNTDTINFYNEVQLTSNIDAVSLSNHYLNNIMDGYKIRLLSDTSDSSTNCGERFMFAVTENEEILFWGWNNGNWFINGDINLYMNSFTKLRNPNPASKVKKIISFGWSVALWYEDGKVYMKGVNNTGILTQAGNTSVQFDWILYAVNVTDLSISGIGHDHQNQHCIMISGNGTVFLTGINNVGQLGKPILNGIDKNTIYNTFFIEKGIGSPKKSYAVGSINQSSYIITDEGKVLGTGFNVHGELGLGDIINKEKFTVIQGLSHKNIVKLAISSGTYSGWYANSVVALSDDGEIFGFGYNEYKLLGVGDSLNNYELLPKKINLPFPYDKIKNPIIDVYSSQSGAEGYTFVLTKNGDLFSAGWNDVGQLGNGSMHNTNYFILVETGVKWVYIPRTTHDNELRATFINKNNKLYATGQNSNYCLGIGQMSSVRSFIEVPLPYPADDIIQMSSCGYDGWCTVYILFKNGKIYASGDNERGQVTPGSPSDATAGKFISVN